MEGGRVLIDTNILVYAWDNADPTRQAKAIETIKKYVDRCLVSVQTLNEFSVVMRKSGKDISWIREKIRIMASLMCVCPLAVEHTHEALRMVEQHKFSYWDALIWAVGKHNGAQFIISEDGPTGNVIEGILYMNPFRENENVRY